jgi:hypothetical protein
MKEIASSSHHLPISCNAVQRLQPKQRSQSTMYTYFKVPFEKQNQDSSDPRDFLGVSRNLVVMAETLAFQSHTPLLLRMYWHCVSWEEITFMKLYGAVTFIA